MKPIVFSKMKSKNGWEYNCKVISYGPDKLRYPSLKY